MNQFTEKDNPGEGLREQYQNLIQKLMIPENYKKDNQLEGSILFQKENYQIIPAFFECLIELKRL